LGQVIVGQTVTFTIPGTTTGYTYPDGITVTANASGPLTISNFSSDAVFNGTPSGFTVTVTLIPRDLGPEAGNLTLGANCGPYPWPNPLTVHLTYVGITPSAPPTNNESKQVNEPISMANGAYINTYLDLVFRGPLPIYFERYYNSSLSTDDGGAVSALGPNWMHNYDYALTVAGTIATITYYHGQVLQFTNTSGAWTQTSSDPFRYQLLQSGTTYRLLDPYSHLVYTFDGSTGRLQTIADRNGNTLTLTYSAGLLNKIADGVGTTLTFTYSAGNLTKVTDHTGRSISFAYTGANLTSATDPSGKTTSFAYNSAGLMTSYTLPRGNTPYLNTYNAAGQVTSQKDAAGNTSTFTYTSGNGQSTMTSPLSQVSTYVHNSGRDLTQETDPAGHVITKSYDSDNRPISHKDPVGNTTAWAWQSAGLIATLTNPDGGQISYTYASSTANGFTYYDLASTSFPDGTTESYTFDAGGNLTSRTSRTGQQWKNTYNGKGQPLTLTLPNNSQIVFTYSTDGNSVPATVTYPNTAAVALTFDSLKRLTTRTFADGSTIALTYDANDRLLTSTNQIGAVATYTYDANGKLASVKDPDGGTSALTYTGTDKIATITDPAGRAVTISYDPVDRPNKVTYGDGSVVQCAYDAADNLVSITDGEGKVWKQGYDPAGEINSFTTPLNAQTVLTLDSMARTTKAVTPGGKTISFAYDLMSRLTSVTDSQQHVSSYSYDKNGQVTGVTIPAGISATYGLDPIADLTTITDPNGNTWNFTYDAAGRVLSRKDPLGQTTTYQRDARGQVKSATLPLGNMTATVDAASRLTHTAFSDNTALDFAWDPANRLTSATGLTFQYDASGALSNSNGLAITADKLAQVTQVTLAPGKAVNYTYDHRGLVTQVTDWVGGNTTFKYDDAGQLISITRPNGITATYTYDADGDVASIQEAGAAALSSISLTRDTRGLVTSANRNVPQSPTPAQLATVQSTHTYDVADQIAEFKYDAMGRRTSDDTRSTYTWDLANRLSGYTASGDSASFTYNAFGWIASQTHGGVTSQYVWNFGLGLPSISVLRSGGADLSYYVHAPNGALLHSVDATGKRRYYHYDEAGNTIFLTDDTGAITDKYAYTEYGALLSPTATDNLFLFQGQYGGMQIGNGLYAMRRRVYDSRSGAFVSREPALLAGPRVINPFEYAVGNPLGFRDVTGTEPERLTPDMVDYLKRMSVGEQFVEIVAPQEDLVKNHKKDKTSSAEKGSKILEVRLTSLPVPVGTPIDEPAIPGVLASGDSLLHGNPVLPVGAFSQTPPTIVAPDTPFIGVSASGNSVLNGIPVPPIGPFGQTLPTIVARRAKPNGSEFFLAWMRIHPEHFSLGVVLTTGFLVKKVLDRGVIQTILTTYIGPDVVSDFFPPAKTQPLEDPDLGRLLKSLGGASPQPEQPYNHPIIIM
jgi:RHS repeat-associated protein